MPKAFGFAEYGGPERLAFLDLPKPTAGPGEVLIAVRAAGVNPVDAAIREGYLRAMIDIPLPAVLGSEVAGVVEQVGEGVEGFAVGDEVFGGSLTGGYAQYTVLPAGLVAHKPAGVSFVQAATLPVAGGTAFDGLQQLDLKPDQTLLVLGVGGGVGVATAQIASGRGIKVIGTASVDKKAFVESLGAVHVNYGDGVTDRIRAAAPDGVDAIFDLVGGADLQAVAELLADRSKLVSTGDPATAGSLGGAPIERTQSSERYQAVAALVVAGALDPTITTYPFERAAEALAEVEVGHARGKVVIQVS